MAKFAVIATGGKQYRVQEGTRLKIELLEGEAGGDVTFDRVLLLADDGTVNVGTPTVEGAKVTGKILEQGKHPKQIIFKMRPKKRYRVKTGHRQPYTEVEITKIAGK
jgi:large subunit ribosomal protein L21